MTTERVMVEKENEEIQSILGFRKMHEEKILSAIWKRKIIWNEKIRC